MIYYFYKIVCDDLPEHVYVGSTMAFANRKYKHKGNCNNENRKDYNLKIYQTIRDNGGWDNWRMVCIHQEDVDNKRQTEQIEEDYRVELNGNMNMRRAFRSEEQKKEYNKEYVKKYRENNKEYYKEYLKEWREQNKESIIEKKKEYYETNKEQLDEKNKEYYEDNKKHILEYRKEKITCECGCFIRKDGLKDHRKTNKHIKLMEL
jgi:hypothetical protein